MNAKEDFDGATCRTCMGEAWLRSGDRFLQTGQVAVKCEGKLVVERCIDCVFVPLLGEHGWKQG
ncbi:MAG: hypothetical protein ABFD94_07055 [Armatimonadia bacterium]